MPRERVAALIRGDPQRAHVALAELPTGECLLLAAANDLTGRLPTVLPLPAKAIGFLKDPVLLVPRSGASTNSHCIFLCLAVLRTTPAEQGQNALLVGLAAYAAPTEFTQPVAGATREKVAGEGVAEFHATLLAHPDAL